MENQPSIVPIAHELKQHLTFTVGPESFGVPAFQVKEIIRPLPITPLPNVPDYVIGIVNLRGRVIPLIDLRLRLHLGQADINERTCIIVTDLEQEFCNEATIGLVVDGVEEVFFPKEVEDANSFGSSLNTEFIQGIVRIDGHVKTLLDIESLITKELKTIS